MSKVGKKLLLVLIPLLVVLVGCLTLLLVLPDKSPQKVYVEQIKSARQLAESGDYEKAVLKYKEAIKEDKTNEEAYLELADIYRVSLNDMDSSISILEEGYENTKSEKIHDQLISLQTIKNGDSVDPTTGKKGNTQQTLVVNTSYTDIFASYDYSKYKNEFTMTSDSPSNGVYIVKYSQYDAEFEYNDSGKIKTLDPKTRRPYSYARPSVIRLKDISTVFPGVEKGITMDDFKKMGADSVTVEDYNDTLKSNLISFELNHLHFELACDKDGYVKGKDAYNAITPEPVEGKEDNVKVSGKAIDVTSGKDVENYKVIFHKGKDNNNGDKAAEAASDGGKYSLEVPAGDYTAEVSSDGYNTEFFSVYVPSGSTEFECNFSISPKLAANQIRFVLEWGSTPADVDSHLQGYCNTGGSKVDVDVSFMNKSVSAGGKVIADLDIDDQDGYGPETITLHNTNGKYEYKIHRYTPFGRLADSGATVKIYTSDSTPITLTVPDNVDDEWWTVCTVENGEVKDLNGKER